jgi:hypothetical protein
LEHHEEIKDMQTLTPSPTKPASKKNAKPQSRELHAIEAKAVDEAVDEVEETGKDTSSTRTSPINRTINPVSLPIRLSPKVPTSIHTAPAPTPAVAGEAEVADSWPASCRRRTISPRSLSSKPTLTPCSPSSIYQLARKKYAPDTLLTFVFL